MRLGVGTAIGGAVILIALGVVRSIAIHSVTGSDARGTVGAVWDAFLGDLGTAAWILAAAGVVVAAAAASLIKPLEIDGPLRRAAHWATVEPERPWLRVLRALVLVALGVLFLADRDAVLTLLFTAAGL